MKRIGTSIIDRAIREDIGIQDVTTNLLIPKGNISEGTIVVKEDAVLCGLDIAKKVFQKLDSQIKISTKFKDGDRVRKNTRIIFMKGDTRAILTAERTALNFLSHLSGIATKTNSFVRQIKPYKAKVLDTRKTIPGLRALQKDAIRCAGGTNHRFNLGEMVLIKDNHRLALGEQSPWTVIIAKIRKRTNKKIEVEVENLSQFVDILKARPDIILLDNMTILQIKKAVSLSKKLPPNRRPRLEVSGGINLNNIRSIAKTGVDLISVGELTHSVRSIDMSLELMA